MPEPIPADPADHLRPLRGRGKELDTIRSALHSVHDNRGTVISIEGTYGSGKTRLLREIRQYIDDFDVLESHSKSGEFDRLVQFAYLIPVFGEPPGEFVQNIAYHSDPYLLRDWLCEKILPCEPANRKKNKTAILLDDLHWVDETSLVALHMSLPWLLENPVALVFTWNTSRPDLRTSRLFDKPDLRTSQLFDKLDQLGSVRISLPPLSVGDSLDIAQDLMPYTFGPAANELIRRADGNPQLIIDLVLGMHEESEIVERTSGSRDFSTKRIPDRLHERIRYHIDSLHENTGLVLRVAALIGKRFSFALLKDRMTVNSAEDEIAIIRSLHEAKRAGLLRLEEDNIVFQNSLVWQSLAEGGGILAQEQPESPTQPGTRDPETQHAASREPRPADLHAEISPMQRRIAELASEGKTNRQIARQLFISPHTVDTHLRRIFKKLNISSRIELARIFLAEDL